MMIRTCRIEIPTGSSYKYEWKDGELSIDRVVNQPYPVNYGFIQNTLSEDGDPTDIFVIAHKPLVPGSLCSVELIGLWVCKDSGKEDNKWLGILHNEKVDICFFLESISGIDKFLRTYKESFKIIREYKSV